MTHHSDPLAAGMHTAHAWLRAVADDLGTEDLTFALRALRAWMHTVRDRIGVPNSAHLTAQLPDYLRGIWYEGWVPSRVPGSHRVAEFVDEFAERAGIPPSDVAFTAGCITSALNRMMSPGQLDHVFAVFPERLGAVLRGEKSMVEA
ncbi:DUF2267 domain-containing protein [Nocardia paucivorans]|uniref:DUF2267 domain-containing protein n=1 Tax=Nocardia paucivorans TaxID=114259 RepID=UPI0002E0B461|nr:DUF2267 domain-containing protein [Nocardia paucivorans]